MFCESGKGGDREMYETILTWKNGERHHNSIYIKRIDQKVAYYLVNRDASRVLYIFEKDTS